MVKASGADKTNKLSLSQFEALVQTFNMNAGDGDLAGNIYEHDFHNDKVGFRIRNVVEEGIITVKSITNSALEGEIGINDTIFAINGAPLGFVTDHRILAEKLKSLARPVRISFQRFDPTRQDLADGADGDMGVDVLAARAITSLTAEDFQVVFRKFDADGSGDLDTFELAGAVNEILGRQPSTSQVTAMVKAAGADKTNSLSLETFETLCRTFDFSATENEALDETLYEHVFTDDKVGFRIQNVAELGIIIVRSLTNLALDGVVGISDTIMAINGAPLGFVTDHRILGKKLGGLKRPVRITFQRYDASKHIYGHAHRHDETKERAPKDEDFQKLSSSRIQEVFFKFDVDGSGDLDTFELAAAVAEITGQQPSTKQVQAMVKLSAADKSNTLSLGEFETLVRTFDWKGDYSGKLGPGIFEVVFSQMSLGFRVKNVPSRGIIAVSKIVDPTLGDRGLGANDTILAINGAPLGFVTHAMVLQQKIGPLKRPLTITFEKFVPLEQAGLAKAMESSKSEVGAFNPHELSAKAIRRVFKKFDKDDSGDLDTFELSAAVSDLNGGLKPTTKQIHAMVAMADKDKTNTLTLEEFEDLVHNFDWEGDYSGEQYAESYEVEFPNRSLGFRVFNNPEQGTISISVINDESLVGKVQPMDHIVAVNGAPLGFVTDSKVLGQKVGPLSRPLTLTFQKYVGSGSLDAESIISAVGASSPKELSSEVIMEVFLRYILLTPSLSLYFFIRFIIFL